jgi:hypothetical protein
VLKQLIVSIPSAPSRRRKLLNRRRWLRRGCFRAAIGRKYAKKARANLRKTAKPRRQAKVQKSRATDGSTDDNCLRGGQMRIDSMHLRA